MPLKARVEKQINQVNPVLNIGILVTDITSGNILYQRNANRAYVPASNMKLFSDAAAMMILGPDYRFATTLSTDATTLADGVLNGSIFLQFSGDPSLTRKDLASLFSQLNTWGIQQIQGDVVLSSNRSKLDAYAPGWMKQDLKYSYGAPLAPFILDENRITVTINPAHRSGMPPLIEFNTQNHSFSVHNHIKTQHGVKNCNIDFQLTKDNALTLTGCIDEKQAAIQQRLAIRNPLLYSQAVIQHQLNHFGVELKGNIISGAQPLNRFELANHLSKPVSELSRQALKRSDNLYADSLYLQAAEARQGAPVSWAQAHTLLKTFLQTQTGINMQSAKLIDGSGLSRDNLLTPKQTVDLLIFLHRRFPMAYEFISSLPVGSFDGTLYKRFHKTKKTGLIRAKTGTMTGVVSLSGYLYTSDAHTLAFAMFINGKQHAKLGVSPRSNALIDALCATFLRHKSKPPLATTSSQQQLPSSFPPAQNALRRDANKNWRRLESDLKRALKKQAVTVLYRDTELLLHDHTQNSKHIINVLQSLKEQYTFDAVLEDEKPPSKTAHVQPFLWIKSQEKHSPHRIWRIRQKEIRSLS